MHRLFALILELKFLFLFFFVFFSHENNQLFVVYNYFVEYQT
jgi:hypothetical protein